MDLQRGYRILWYSLGQRISLLCLELRNRGYVELLSIFPKTSLTNGRIGGTPARSWAFRACVIQGTQQLYVAFLWYWGASLASGSGSSSLVAKTGGTVAGVTTPIAFLLWGLGVILFIGLPDYYRQKPGAVPSFYVSMLRRKVILVSAHSLFPLNALLTGTIVVFRHGHHPKLLAINAIPEKLEVSLVQPTRPNLGHCAPHPTLLWGSLGRRALCPGPAFKVAFLDHPHLRHRPRRPSMGAIAVGRLQHRQLRPVGQLGRRCRPRKAPLAVARSSRCTTRRRLRHDSHADPYSIPHRCHISRGAIHRLHRDDYRSRLGPRQGRTGLRVPRLHVGSRCRGRQAVFLDLPPLPTRHPNRLLQILPQGTIVQTMRPHTTKISFFFPSSTTPFLTILVCPLFPRILFFKKNLSSIFRERDVTIMHSRTIGVFGG